MDTNGPAAVQEARRRDHSGSRQCVDPWFAKWGAAPKDSLDEPLRCLFDREDITDRLGEITCPAIVFHGDADQAIPLTKAETLAERLSGCESLVVVAGGPHACNLSHPNQVNGPLIDFLRHRA